ncbi:class I tRNA ligase family protein [Xenorhabdus nematophila]|uniref:class I tRNA ligase family protein n=1 Tax=Xenorhabdus nematophila TaxID=628 RepID=UPI0032B739CF
MKKINIFSPSVLSYNVASRPVELVGTNASLMGCSLAPGQESSAHNHFENEIFIFTAGKGVVKTGHESINVQAGDAVLCQRFENHTIVNTSEEDSLQFHSIYWDAGDINTSVTDTPAPSGQRNTLIFSTPPTPNGDLHLGHLSGPYLAGDVLKRVLLQSGASVHHGTGRDDNQTYVVTSTAKEQLQPTESADFYASAINETWQGFGIDFDLFITPDNQGEYADFVHHYIELLYKKDLIYEKETTGYVDHHGNTLHEAYIHGLCPYCEESSDGNACEACGRPNECTDLKQPQAKADGSQPLPRKESRLYFRLSAFAHQLAQYVQTANMPAHVHQLCHDMLSQPLPDICISHASHWGIKHRLPNYEQQVVYVWFEMAMGYLWAASEHPASRGNNRMEKAADVYSGDTNIVHCYGFDNAFYHTLLFPAVYFALGLTPPQTHIVNELLDLEGSKFSTSRRHLIWGKDFLKLAGADYARMALMLMRPEGVRENFSVEKVAATMNALFPQRLSHWLSSLQECVMRYGGKIPESGAWLADQKNHYHELLHVMTGYQHFSQTENFSPRRMAEHVTKLIDMAYRFNASQRHLFPRNSNALSNYARTALTLDALAARMLVYALKPLMPALSADIAALLRINVTEETWQQATTFLASQHMIQPRKIMLPELSATGLVQLVPQ